MDLGKELNFLSPVSTRLDIGPKNPKYLGLVFGFPFYKEFGISKRRERV